MSEVFGIIIIAAAFAVLTAFTPWLRRNQDAWYMRVFLGDMVAIGFIAVIGIGASMVLVQLNRMLNAGETTTLLLSIVALVVAVPLTVYGIRRLVRAATPAH